MPLKMLMQLSVSCLLFEVFCQPSQVVRECLHGGVLFEQPRQPSHSSLSGFAAVSALVFVTGVVL